MKAAIVSVPEHISLGPIKNQKKLFGFSGLNKAKLLPESDETTQKLAGAGRYNPNVKGRIY